MSEPIDLDLEATENEFRYFGQIGDHRLNGRDVVKIGMAFKGVEGTPTGYLCMTGALIHIDLDFKVPNASLQEAAKMAEQHVLDVFARNAEYSGHVYRTMRGIRILMTHRLGWPHECKEEIAAFDQDSDYAEACLREGHWSIRITPKPGDPNTFVCLKIMEFIGPNGEQPDARRLVDIHDRICCPRYEG